MINKPNAATQAHTQSQLTIISRKMLSFFVTSFLPFQTDQQLSRRVPGGQYYFSVVPVGESQRVAAE
jgi:hypothetical protein